MMDRRTDGRMDRANIQKVLSWTWTCAGLRGKEDIREKTIFMSKQKYKYIIFAYIIFVVRFCLITVCFVDLFSPEVQ